MTGQSSGGMRNWCGRRRKKCRASVRYVASATTRNAAAVLLLGSRAVA